MNLLKELKATMKENKARAIYERGIERHRRINVLNDIARIKGVVKMTSPSDILESDAYHDNKTTVDCSECGATIDTEQDYYGESIDREKFCCFDCRKDFAMIGAIKSKTGDEPTTFFACASHGGEEVTSRKFFNESQALKRAEELAELAWDVRSYIERG